MASNTEAAAVRARRKAATKTDAPPAPVTVGANEPARVYPALGDPREPVAVGAEFSRPHPLARPREVAEATGWTMDMANSPDFAVAECDAYETILPKGCVTPTSRLRWAKGQHVPVEIYRAWQAQRATEPGAADPPEADPTV